MTLRYPYVGPATVRARALAEPPGTPIHTREDLAQWVRRHPDGVTEGATFIVDLAGVLWVAPRRSEHVACAQGADVQTAGELFLARDRRGALTVTALTNQSTGYCPEPTSFDAIAAALDGLNIARPPAWTTAFWFRRCPRCAQLALVKDDVFECAVCQHTLPRERNL